VDFGPQNLYHSEVLAAREKPLFQILKELPCGRIYDYLDDPVEIGIDACHPVQRTAGMDLATVKKCYGDRICLVGNIDSSRTLPFGTLAPVEAETLEALRAAAPGYGYILASDHSLHDGIPVKNILHMFRVARKYGSYSNLFQEI
jgi:uroporphyrinogen decarboxylase